MISASKAYCGDIAKCPGSSIDDAMAHSWYRLFWEVGKLMYHGEQGQVRDFALHKIGRRPVKVLEIDPQLYPLFPTKPKRGEHAGREKDQFIARRVCSVELSPFASPVEHVRSDGPPRLPRTRHRAAGRGQDAHPARQTCAQRAEIFRSLGNPSLRRKPRMAVASHARPRLSLGDQKSNANCRKHQPSSLKLMNEDPFKLTFGGLFISCARSSHVGNVVVRSP